MLTPLYAITLFVSAGLMFSLEPMVGKMVLPTLGGTPAVWNTCMVFFQAALLVGYAYSHYVGTRLRGSAQAGIHVALLGIGLLVLPIAVMRGTTPNGTDDPSFWLLGRLTLTVALPFVALAGTTPLLQKWFSHARQAGSDDPYFLYVASNAGSLLALLCYPLLIERFFDLNRQRHAWAFGYVGLIVLTTVCAIAWRKTSVRDPQNMEPPKHRNIPKATPLQTVKRRSSLGQRLWWLILAAVPSSLMLGVTTHITTNLAAVPLLWVLPLGIYLLTFILSFARRERMSVELASRLLPFVVLLVAPLFFFSLPFPELEWRFLTAHLLLFFLAAMICHGRLARGRPEPTRLTEFYLWISIGGVLGGIFNTLLSPLLFSHVLEYPLMIGAACLLRLPGTTPTPRQQRLDYVLSVVALLAAGVFFMAILRVPTVGASIFLLVLAAFMMTCGLLFRRKPLAFASTYVMAVASVGIFAHVEQGDLLHIERNFFSVKRVIVLHGGIGGPLADAASPPIPSLHCLYHGTTIHGIQAWGPSPDREPRAYYHPGGPIADLFQYIVGNEPDRQIGVVGLGAGAVASYLWPTQHIDFHEIDPAVARIAQNPAYFTFLTTCAGKPRILLGDGRLTLSRVPDGAYRLLLLDAYSSDAIPTHLLSREAMRLYLSKLDDHGVMAFHVTNRFMNLIPLVANLAHDAGLVCLARSEQWLPEQADRFLAKGYAAADVVAVARHIEDLNALTASDQWNPVEPDLDLPIWTDSYSNIVGLLLRGPGFVRNHGPSHHKGTGPGPLEVVPTQSAIHIQNLAGQIQSRTASRLQRRGLDLR